MRQGTLFLVLAAVIALVVALVVSQSDQPRSGPTSKKSSPVLKNSAEDEFLDSTPRLRDVAGEAGITFRMGFLPDEQGATFKINLYDHGCGLAVGDCNGDGLDDIYFLNQLGPNALYRNQGDGTFKDVTAEMGVALGDRICVGATFSDYDNDGDQDLYVTSTRGGNVLFQNQDNVRFIEVTEKAGLKHVGHSQTAAFFDYNRDSLLDLYVVQTAEWTTETYNEASRYFAGKGGEGGLQAVISSPKEYNFLYLNNGDGTFTDVTKKAGLVGRGWSSDVAVFDYDSDGWLDVFVVCMFGRAQLYHNKKDGTFEDVTLDVLGRTPFGGIGAKVFDFDNDGLLDIYVVDMHSDMWMGLDYAHDSYEIAQQSEGVKFRSMYGPRGEGRDEEKFKQLADKLEDVLDFRHSEVIFGNAFYKNLGNGHFAEISQENNTETFWPWGLATGDFNNDGFVDSFVATGMGFPFYYWPNRLLINDGHGLFREGSREFGIEPPADGIFLKNSINGVRGVRSSRCAAAADFDQDGRLEIVTNNFNQSPYLFHNELPEKNFVSFRLKGTRSNADAIGAVVRVISGDQSLMRQVQAAGGYLSQSSKTLHFGLGDRTHIDRAEIEWPSGDRQVLDSPAINRRHEVIENEVIEKKG